MLASVFASAFRAKGPPAKPEEFMLSTARAEPKQQTVEEMQQRLRLAFKTKE